jgi:hypothetical protein
MDAKRFVTGTVVGGIVLFATGFVIFSVALADFYGANSVAGVNRETPIIWASIVASIAYAALITYALGNRSAAIGNATRVGAITGLLLWGTADLAIHRVMNVSNVTLAFVDPVVEFLHGGLGGAAIGAVLSRMPSR